MTAPKYDSPDWADYMLSILTAVPDYAGPMAGQVWRGVSSHRTVRVTCVTATRVHGTFVDTEIGWDWPIGSFSMTYEKAL